jgi:DNA phosphorothioation-associated putative methyltransferase
MIHTHRTAIKRTRASKPLRDLLDFEPQTFGTSVLDYGCGYGEDVAFLRDQRMVSMGYDPHKPFGYSRMTTHNFDIVLLIYVLNVLPRREEREDTIKKAWERVAPGGFLFVATRSPAEIWKLQAKNCWKSCEDGFLTKKKTFQKGLSEMALRALALPLDYVEMTSIKGTLYSNLLIAKGRWNGR